MDSQRLSYWLLEVCSTLKPKLLPTGVPTQKTERIKRKDLREMIELIDFGYLACFVSRARTVTACT
jgi:hypothetical protein